MIVLYQTLSHTALIFQVCFDETVLYTLVQSTAKYAQTLPKPPKYKDYKIRNKLLQISIKDRLRRFMMQVAQWAT